MKKTNRNVSWKILLLGLFYTIYFLKSEICFSKVEDVEAYKRQLEVIEKVREEGKNQSEELELLEKKMGELRKNFSPFLKSSKEVSSKGVKDANFPHFFNTRPSKISIPVGLQEKLFPGEKGFVSIHDLTPDRLKKLDSQDFKSLLTHLKNIPLQLKWKNKKGHCQSGKTAIGVRLSHWEKSNGIAVLALFLGMKKERKLLEKILLEYPNEVTKTLKENAFSILDEKLVANVLVKSIDRAPLEKYREVASSTAHLVQVYIMYWADKKPDRLMLAVTGLVLESTKILHKKNYKFEPAEKGILLGALLAGSLLRTRDIKSQDERKLWIVNSIANLAWAASTFLGALPVSSSIAAGLAATLSIAVVAWEVVANKTGVRDFSPGLKEIEGHIEFSVLEAVQKFQNQNKKLEALEMLAWMRSAIHINGLSD